MIFNNLPVTFPWYDKIEKQNRSKVGADGVCDYKLHTPYNAILPFQFRRLRNLFGPETWEIYNANTNQVVADLMPSLIKIQAASLGNYDYFFYDGSLLTTTEGVLDLDRQMFYYSKITMQNGQQFFSELFFVPEISINVLGTESTQFLKLTFYNDADLPPLHFNGTFKQIVYLETHVHASEPEVEEESTPDGYDNQIPTFQKVVIKFRMAVLVPDFLKIALSTLPLYDHVFILTEGSKYEGEVFRLSTSASIEEDGLLSVVDVLFEEDVAMIKKNCPENLPIYFPPIGGEPELFYVREIGDFLEVSGNTWPDTVNFLYASATSTGTYEKIPVALQFNKVNDASAKVPIAYGTGKNFFYLSMGSFAGGVISNTVPKT